MLPEESYFVKSAVSRQRLETAESCGRIFAVFLEINASIKNIFLSPQAVFRRFAHAGNISKSSVHATYLYYFETHVYAHKLGAYT